MKKLLCQMMLVFSIVLIVGLSPGYAESYHWKNAPVSTDWADPNNWNPDGGVPGVPGELDIVYPAPTGPTHITVPESGASAKVFYMTTSNDCTIDGGPLTLGLDDYGSTISGSWNTNKLTFNNTVRSTGDFHVKAGNEGPYSVTFNGPIVPNTADPNASKTFRTYGINVVVNGNNDNIYLFYPIYAVEITAGHPNALGYGYYYAYNESTLSLTSDVNMGTYLNFWASNTYLRNRGSGGMHTLTVREYTGTYSDNSTVTILENPDNASNSALTIRLETIGPDYYNGVNWITRSDTVISVGDNASGPIYLGKALNNSNISGGGKVVVDSNAALVYFSGPHSYTGGTFINKGTALLTGNDYIPSAGDLSVAGGATFDLNTDNQTVRYLNGGNSVTSAIIDGPGTLTVNGGLVPGNNGFGKIKFQNASLLTLGASSASEFELLNQETDQDKVEIAGNVTLGGTLTVKGLANLNGGTYTLISVTGAGNTISGSFSNVIYDLPPNVTGTYQVTTTAVQVIIGSSITWAATPVLNPDGGVYATARNVTMTCSTPGAVIRYTTDGTLPTAASTLYSVPVLVDHDLTLKARAFASGFADSAVKTAIYRFPVPNNPVGIRADTVTVDGYFTEWTSGEWVELTEIYAGDPNAVQAELPEAYYALRWSPANNKLYMAVKVRDTQHFLWDYYDDWGSQDMVEIYVHTTGVSDNAAYLDDQAAAQQYEVGVKDSNRIAVWTGMGYMLETIPEFQAAGREDGEWLYYEVAITPFQYMGWFTGQPNIVSTLHADDMVGLDVAVSGRNPDNWVGMKSENMMTGKYNNYDAIGVHALLAIPGDADKDGHVNNTDLGILAANFGTDPGATWAMGDFNADGKVDAVDLNTLADHYEP